MSKYIDLTDNGLDKFTVRRFNNLITDLYSRNYTKLTEYSYQRECRERITYRITEYINTRYETIRHSKKSSIDDYDRIRDITYNFIMNNTVAAVYKKQLIHGINPEFIYNDRKFLKAIYLMYFANQLEAYEIIGKNRFTSINEETLYRIIEHSFFNSGHVVPMSGDSYSDANVRAVFLYHSKKITPRILNKICDIVDNMENYRGRIDKTKLLEYVRKHCNEVLESDSSLKLYFEII